MGWMFYIWLIILVITVVVELTTTKSISLNFAIGSLVSLIVAAFLKDKLILVQLLTFIIFTSLSIIMLCPLVNKKLTSNKQVPNKDVLIGKTAIVSSNISSNQQGLVKVDGNEWKAISLSALYAVGELVEIINIEDNILIVKDKKI